MQGIYRIDGPKNKVYIGSTTNFKARWYLHKWKLRRNEHHSPKLQNAWNKYGEDAFKFSIIEAVENTDDLDRIEQIWLDILFTSLESDEIYNIYCSANSPRGAVRGAEARKKQSDQMRGRRWTEEHKQNIAKSKIGVSRGMEMSNNQALQRSGGKIYTLIDPTGNKHENIINLAIFCKERNLSRGHMRDVIFGNRNQHKGWKGILSNKEELIDV